MPRIPEYRQRELPTTNIGAAPMPVSGADVNQGAVGRGLTAVGQGIGNFGESMFQIDQMHRQDKDILAESKLKNEIDLAEKEYTLATEQDGNPENWPKYQQMAQKRVESLAGTLTWGNKETKQRADLMTSGWSDIFNKQSQIQAVKKTNTDAIAVSKIDFVNSLSSTDPKQAQMVEFNEATYRRALSSSYSPDAVDKLVEDARHDGTIKQIQSQIVLNPSDTVVDGKVIPGMVTKLQAELNARKEGKTTNKQWKESLPDSKDIDDLLTTARSILNRNDDKLEKEQDKKRLEFYEKAYIKNEPLTWDEVKGSILEDDDKISLWNSYSKAQEEKQKAGISQLEEGDPIVLAKTTAAIDLAPERITEKNIWELADKGVGLKNAPGLVNRLRAAQKPDKDPIKDKYNAELSRLHAAGLFGDKDKVKTSDIYLKLQRKLDVFLTSKPTDEQTRVFFANLIREDVSWGHSFDANELPGFGESPLQTTIQTNAGAKPISITYGDIVEIDGQYMQAVGRKNDKIIWQPVNPQ